MAKIRLAIHKFVDTWVVSFGGFYVYRCVFLWYIFISILVIYLGMKSLGYIW